MNIRDSLSAEDLRKWLSYDRDTGEFRWRARPTMKSQVVIGAVAGTRSHGYVAIGIAGRRYLAHRLAFLHVNGQWPAQCVDHVSGDRSDNRWSNLREASYQLNNENHRTASSHNRHSKLLGVSWRADKRKWRASIARNNRAIHLGYFEEEQAAYAAYLAAKRTMHAGCSI